MTVAITPWTRSRLAVRSGRRMCAGRRPSRSRRGWPPRAPRKASGRGQTAPPVGARVPPATGRGILGNLAGTWRSRSGFAELQRTPDVTGIRVLRVLFDDLRLEWKPKSWITRRRGARPRRLRSPRATVSQPNSRWTTSGPPRVLTGVLTMPSRASSSTRLSISARCGGASPSAVLELCGASTATISRLDCAGSCLAPCFSRQ